MAAELLPSYRCLGCLSLAARWWAHPCRVPPRIRRRDDPVVDSHKWKWLYPVGKKSLATEPACAPSNVHALDSNRDEEWGRPGTADRTVVGLDLIVRKHHCREATNMDNGVAQIEQRFAQIEQELAWTRQQLTKARRGSHGVIWGWRALGAATLAMVATGITVVSASTGPQTLTVKAPFTVVDDSGQPVMEVASNGIRLSHKGVAFMYATETGIGLTHGNTPLVGLVSTSGGGRLQVDSKAGAMVGSLGYDPKSGATQLLVSGNGSSATLGTHNSALGLRFFKGSQETAGMGQTTSGGAISLYRASGSVATALGSDASGMGYMEIDTASGVPSVALQQHSGGGYFALTNPGGTARVEAGVLPGDLGVVRTFGPTGFDYIEGK